MAKYNYNQPETKAVEKRIKELVESEPNDIKAQKIEKLVPKDGEIKELRLEKALGITDEKLQRRKAAGL